MKAVHILLSVLSTTDIILNKLYDGVKLLNLRPSLYISMQKAVILTTCRTVRQFLAE